MKTELKNKKGEELLWKLEAGRQLYHSSCFYSNSLGRRLVTKIEISIRNN